MSCRKIVLDILEFDWLPFEGAAMAKRIVEASRERGAEIRILANEHQKRSLVQQRVAVPIDASLHEGLVALEVVG